jgi:CBS domain-containing protein
MPLEAATDGGKRALDRWDSRNGTLSILGFHGVHTPTVDIARFLGRHAPFDSLDAKLLSTIAEAVLVEFFPKGSIILEQGGPPAEHVYVIRSGAVEILEDGRLLDLAGEGEVLGALSVVSEEGPTATARAHEDTLCYLIGREVASAALASGSGLSVIGRALRRIVIRSQEGVRYDDLGRTRVGSLVRRPPVTFPAEGTVAEAAARMVEDRISSLLIPLRQGFGILTDRDLRSRVLASGRPPETRVEEVMTSPAHTISSDSMVGEALLEMLDGGFHHLPVVDGVGHLIGIVTDTDLLGLARQSPFALKSAIERSVDEASAIDAARRLPATASELVEASVDPVDVGHVVGATLDTLSRRLIELAISRLGQPPVPWAWIALGSEARHEQALRTDQDHALAYEQDGRSQPELDAYFATLAEAVTSGLEAAGIPRCRGDAMAVHPTLRRSLAGWLAQFRSWMSDPGIEGSTLTSITFDFRRIAGSLDIETPLNDLIRSAPRAYPQFLRHLAHRALDHRPPTGFFGNLVVERHGEHAGQLDVKRGGIMILTSLARAWALRAGRTEKRTLQRIQAALDTGQIDEDARLALEEGFRLLWQVRLDHQVAMIRKGRPPDDFVDPRSLGSITRRGLKEAFRIIEREQRGLAIELGVR